MKYNISDLVPSLNKTELCCYLVVCEGIRACIAELGIYPAVDPLDSTSRIMDPNVVGAEHYDVARGVQKILQARHQLVVDNFNTFKNKARQCVFFFRITSHCRTSLLFWVWMNCLRKTG